MSYVDDVVVHVLHLRVEVVTSDAQAHIVTTNMPYPHEGRNRMGEKVLRLLSNIGAYTTNMEKGRGLGRSGTIVTEVPIVVRILNVVTSYSMRDILIRMDVAILGIMAIKTKKVHL